MLRGNFFLRKTPHSQLVTTVYLRSTVRTTYSTTSILLFFPLFFFAGRDFVANSSPNKRKRGFASFLISSFSHALFFSHRFSKEREGGGTVTEDFCCKHTHKVSFAARRRRRRTGGGRLKISLGHSAGRMTETHTWHISNHARPTFCNVCRESLSGELRKRERRGEIQKRRPDVMSGRDGW